ncbi:MAG: hypothetical protein M3Y49_04610 [Actinomycetota bacterium]|nr:hypothetical protein [Actinomycetota bacterium]
MSYVVLGMIASPALAGRLLGTSPGWIRNVLESLGHLPWWADLALLAIGGAGVLLTIVRRYGLR